MIWNICLLLSLLIFAASCLWAYSASRNYTGGQIFTPMNIVFGGMVLTVFTALVPIFANILENEYIFVPKLIFFDILETMQVFTINVDGDMILDNVNSALCPISTGYSAYTIVLFVVSPLLTFGFVLSLFKNVFDGIRLRFRHRGDVYVFTAMNERSLLLAKSIRENHGKAVLVFAGVDSEASESDAGETAKELNAFVLKKDAVSLSFKHHAKAAKLQFFAIGDDENGNIIESLKLIEKYRGRENTGIYVFSSEAAGELLLSGVERGHVKLRRVNEIHSLVYHFLYEKGEELFRTAKNAGDGEREINAVVVGLGRYGSELVKALSWYCQMDGYTLNINAFDKDEAAESKFTALCPELMSEKYNGVFREGESRCSIHVRSGIDVDTAAFADELCGLKETSYVFVCLGEDEQNINASANIRMLCERYGIKAPIITVVYNPQENQALANITNYRGQAYNIHAIGDLETLYSEENLMANELEKLALQRHLKWGAEEEFWRYEYNYRSSMASAIHLKAKIACGIPGAAKPESELTEEDRRTLEALEHRRWNAYMRSEGYVYSGSHDKRSRNDLAKMHHDLVAFDELTEQEKRKDSSVSTV